jgi:4-amino-4-deoxy-L-arabinose transferase-like glycosyltransferase
VSNIILSIGIVILIYKIIKINLNSDTAAFMGGLIWALWPSQISEIVILGNEYFFIFMLLLSIFLFLKLYIQKNNRIKDIIILSFLLGLVTALANFFRPVIIVLLVAMILLYILKRKGMKIKHILLSLGIIFSVFLIIQFAFNNLITYYIQRDIAVKDTFGYYVYVGSNIKSNGHWNSDDAAFRNQLINQGFTANKIQEILAKKAFSERILNNFFEFIKIQPMKFFDMWGTDTIPLDYILISTKNETQLNVAKEMELLFNIFYIMVMIICICGVIRVFKNIEDNSFLLYTLFICGVVFSHIFLEVQPRYHFTLIPLFILIAVQTNFSLFLKRSK